MEAVDWLVRFVGASVITLGVLWLAARDVLTVVDWHRSRPAYVRDYTDAREYMAVAVMLCRRCWTIRLPGIWVIVARPLYGKAAYRAAWDDHRIFATSALARVRKYAPNRENGA